METVRYENKWPWGVDILHIATDGKATVGVSKQDGFDFAFIHDLIVHESVRKQGIGQYLLDLAELEAIRAYKCNLALFRVRGWNNGTGATDTKHTKPNLRLMDILS